MSWLDEYPLNRPVGDGEYLVLHPLTFGRWRLSVANVWGREQGY